MDKRRVWDRTPRGRANKFLCHCREKGRPCTSTYEEVIALFASGVDWRGRPLDPGARYHMEHVHGGPAIGLVPSWLNRAMDRRIVDNWAEFRECAKLSRGLE
ncbi:MAG: hypothetical protein WC935_00085 [Thermoleophilia bacterium]